MDLGIDKKLKQLALGIACVFTSAACVGALAYEGIKSREKQETPECVVLRQNMASVFDQAVALQKNTSSPIAYITVVAKPDRTGHGCYFQKTSP